MITQENVLQELILHYNELQDKFAVKSLAIFGSVARNEINENSDIDLLVEFNSPVGLFEFLTLQDYLQTLFNRKVDLVTKSALKPQLRDKILQEAIYAYNFRRNANL